MKKLIVILLAAYNLATAAPVGSQTTQEANKPQVIMVKPNAQQQAQTTANPATHTRRHRSPERTANHERYLDEHGHYEHRHEHKKHKLK